MADPKQNFIITARDESREAFDSFNKRMGITLGSIAAAGLSFTKLVKNSIEVENAISQLDNKIRSTGGSAGFTRDQLVKMASGLQNVTTYGDQAVMEMQALLLTFREIQGSQFAGAQEAILNMATSLGTDLKTAAMQVGKALNNPAEGLSALKKAGVSFSDAQEKTIKALTSTGRAAEAQDLILKELEKSFGGSAKAARETFGGSLTALNNAFGNLLQGNNLTGASQEIEKLTKILQDPKTVESANALFSVLIKGFANIAGVIPTITNFFSKSIDFFAGSLDPIAVINKDIEKTSKKLELIRQKNEPLVKWGLMKDLGEDARLLKLDLDNLIMTRDRMLAKKSTVTEEPVKEERRTTKPIIDEDTQKEIDKLRDIVKTKQDILNEEFVKKSELANRYIFDETERAAIIRQLELDRDAIKIEELEKLRNFGLTETQLEMEAHQKRVDILNANMEEGEARKRLLESLEQKHQDKITEINKKALSQREKFEKMSAINKTKFVVGQLIEMTEGVAQQSKSMFKINKAAGIANAIINTYQGATKALADYPPPLSFAMAALQVAAGLKQIQAIKNTQFGSGNAAPSMQGQGGGAGQPQNVVPIQPRQTEQSSQSAVNVNITFAGSAIGLEDIQSTIVDSVKKALDLNQLTLTSGNQIVKVA